jgi:hypothetical protein
VYFVKSKNAIYSELDNRQLNERSIHHAMKGPSVIIIHTLINGALRVVIVELAQDMYVAGSLQS